MYEKDDGPLTQKQLDLIKQNSSANSTPEELFTQTLPVFVTKEIDSKIHNSVKTES